MAVSMIRIPLLRIEKKGNSAPKPAQQKSQEKSKEKKVAFKP
jgi:hypothetical protein